MEFLRDRLGEELYDQVAEKLKDSGIKLADLSGGAYVGKDKHDGVVEQLRLAKEALGSFGGKTVDEINAEIGSWKQKAEQAETKANERIAAMEFDSALTAALTGARAKNPKAVAALLNRDALKYADGAIVGLKEQLDAVRKDNTYLFDAEPSEGAGFSGRKPPNALPSGTSEAMNTILRSGTSG